MTSQGAVWWRIRCQLFALLDCSSILHAFFTGVNGHTRYKALVNPSHVTDAALIPALHWLNCSYSWFSVRSEIGPSTPTSLPCNLTRLKSAQSKRCKSWVIPLHPVEILLIYTGLIMSRIWYIDLWGGGGGAMITICKYLKHGKAWEGT